MILCGHTNCGAVAGSLSLPPEAPGTVNLWLADLKDTARQYADKLESVVDEKEKTDMCAATPPCQVAAPQGCQFVPVMLAIDTESASTAHRIFPFCCVMNPKGSCRCWMPHLKLQVSTGAAIHVLGRVHAI